MVQHRRVGIPPCSRAGKRPLAGPIQYYADIQTRGRRRPYGHKDHTSCEPLLARWSLCQTCTVHDLRAMEANTPGPRHTRSRSLASPPAQEKARISTLERRTLGSPSEGPPTPPPPPPQNSRDSSSSMRLARSPV